MEATKGTSKHSQTYDVYESLRLPRAKNSTSQIHKASTVSSSSVAWDMLTHCHLTYINHDDFVSMVQGFGRGPGKCLYTMRHTQGLNPQDDCITSPVFALFTIGSEIHPLLTTGLWFFKQVRVLLRSAFDVLRSAIISFIKKRSYLDYLGLAYKDMCHTGSMFQSFDLLLSSSLDAFS